MEMRTERAEKMAAMQRKEQEKADNEAEEKETQSKFFEMCEKSEDLEDNLQDLVNFLQAQTGATGVYFGKLRYPEKKIDEDADPSSHLDDEAPKVIKYSHASKGHEFMVDVVLAPDQGVITHSVFNEADDEENQEEAEDPEVASGKSKK